MPGLQLAGVQGHLQVGQIVVGAQDDRLGGGDVEILEHALLATVADAHGHAVLAGEREVRALRVFLQHRHLLAEGQQLLERSQAELAQAAENHVIVRVSCTWHASIPVPSRRDGECGS